MKFAWLDVYWAHTRKFHYWNPPHFTTGKRQLDHDNSLALNRNAIIGVHPRNIFTRYEFHGIPKSLLGNFCWIVRWMNKARIAEGYWNSICGPVSLMCPWLICGKKENVIYASCMRFFFLRDKEEGRWRKRKLNAKGWNRDSINLESTVLFCAT